MGGARSVLRRKSNEY